MLKQESIRTHREWIANGRVDSGPVYEAKRQAKNMYKNHIRSQQDADLSTISKDLHDALSVKNSTAFWKSWKSKFRKKT